MRISRHALRFAILVSVVAALSGFLVYAQVRFSSPFFARLSLESLSPLECTENDVLLVIAPHCDDEVFGAGGFIYDAVKKGAQVYVVVMTNGDAFHLFFIRPSRATVLGDRRQRETLEALGILGIPEEHVFFLGYPDRGLEFLWYEHWSPDIPYLSRFTRREVTPLTSFKPGNPYCGESVAANLEEILSFVRPTIVLTASPFDTHPDHRATYNFTMYALERLRYQDPFFEDTRVFWYLVHWSFWPHGSVTGATVKLLPPRELLVPTIRWQYYFLERDTIFAKTRAVRKYRSQSAGGYPLSFVRANELFVEARGVKIPTLEGEVVIDGCWSDWEGPSVTLVFPEAKVRGNGIRRSSKSLFLAMARDAEHLYLAVQAPLPERVVYHFHFLPLTPLPEAGVHLNMTVETSGRKVVTIPAEDEEFPGVRYALGKEGLEIVIPLHFLRHAPAVFFRMEAQVKEKVLAETVWKIVTF